MIFVQLSFQTNYGLVYLVKNEEIMGRSFVMSKKVKDRRNVVEWKSIYSESICRQIKMRIRKNGFERWNLWILLGHFTVTKGESIVPCHKVE